MAALLLGILYGRLVQLYTLALLRMYSAHTLYVLLYWYVIHLLITNVPTDAFRILPDDILPTDYWKKPSNNL